MPPVKRRHKSSQVLNFLQWTIYRVSYIRVHWLPLVPMLLRGGKTCINLCFVFKAHGVFQMIYIVPLAGMILCITGWLANCCGNPEKLLMPLGKTPWTFKGLFWITLFEMPTIGGMLIPLVFSDAPMSCRACVIDEGFGRGGGLSNGEFEEAWFWGMLDLKK